MLHFTSALRYGIRFLTVFAAAFNSYSQYLRCVLEPGIGLYVDGIFHEETSGYRMYTELRTHTETDKHNKTLQRYSHTDIHTDIVTHPHMKSPTDRHALI